MGEPGAAEHFDRRIGRRRPADRGRRSFHVFFADRVALQLSVEGAYAEKLFATGMFSPLHSELGR